MKNHWHILTPDSDLIKGIADALKFSPVTSSVLINRGITSPEQALSFLHASLDGIRSPFKIKDIDIAANRIRTAITNKEKILIFGDYDADGITSTSILLEFLTYTGACVDYYIPHRKDEGYGLQQFHITEHALPSQINLIITADCGSSSHKAASEAKKAGIDVIIIDHHNIAQDLPVAEAVVNPKRHDCDSCFHDLSAVGVVFCVLICLRKHLRDAGFWQTLLEPNLKTPCDLVALGTMADIVPLINENRIFVKAGLDMIRHTKRPGIQALIEASNINTAVVEEQDIAFKLVPRLNAAGRIDHAKVAVELLLEKDAGNASHMAQSLSKMNTKRQQIERNILHAIESYLEKNPRLLQNPSLVLADENWDEGVLGIVASKLVDKYFRPVVLFSLVDGIGKGSARSIPGFDLYNGLQLCSNILETFGGHKMAAGLKIKEPNINIFKKAFDDTVSKTTKPEDFTPLLRIDGEVKFDEITEKLVDEIEQLKPFGSGNTEPIFMAKQIRVVSSAIVGKHHRRMRLNQDSGKRINTFNAICFNIDPMFETTDSFEEIAYHLRWNRWNGRKSIQLIVVDMKVSSQTF